MSMPILRICGLVFALGCAPLTAAAAGPFGIEMGTPIERLDVAKPSTHSGYELNSVPKPDPAFVRYAVRAPSKFGVCMVKAMSETHLGSGTQAVERSRARLIEHLSKLYGPPSSQHDQPLVDAVRFDARLPIEESDGKVGTVWSSDDGTPLPGNITTIILEVVSVDNNHYAFFVTFGLENESPCFGAAFSHADGAGDHPLTQRNTPERCWELQNADGSTNPAWELCFDGHGGVLSSVASGDAVGMETAETPGRYSGKYGRIRFISGGEGDGWLWDWLDVSCDLLEEGNIAKLVRCMGTDPIPHLNPSAQPADMTFLVRP